MNTIIKNCEHKYECGCDRAYCEDCATKNENDDLDQCDDESCKHYYSYRNDNCNCDGDECGFCNPVSLCDNCRCRLTDDIHIFCFEKDGEGDKTMCAECGNDLAFDMREDGWKRDDDEDKCFECGGEIDQDYQEKLDRAGFIDGRSEVCCENCWKENWEASGEEYDECEECGNLFELGTFHTIEETNGTQFCFCDGCRDTLVENGSIFATQEEGVYVREQPITQV